MSLGIGTYTREIITTMNISIYSQSLLLPSSSELFVAVIFSFVERTLCIRAMFLTNFKSITQYC